MIVHNLCIFVYRDIFIFRKNNRITGIAKIYFGCGDARISGTEQNTYGFGCNNEFSVLRELIR